MTAENYITAAQIYACLSSVILYSLVLSKLTLHQALSTSTEYKSIITRKRCHTEDKMDKNACQPIQVNSIVNFAFYWHKAGEGEKEKKVELQTKERLGHNLNSRFISGCSEKRITFVSITPINCAIPQEAVLSESQQQRAAKDNLKAELPSSSQRHPKAFQGPRGDSYQRWLWHPPPRQ